MRDWKLVNRESISQNSQETKEFNSLVIAQYS